MCCSIPAEELEAMGAFSMIRELTAGVPRQVHRMVDALLVLKLQSKPTSFVEELRQLALAISQAFQHELLRLSREDKTNQSDPGLPPSSQIGLLQDSTTCATQCNSATF
ncbi:hypothetical protein QOT17_020677 [Balamuthia mandrillaris]